MERRGAAEPVEQRSRVADAVARELLVQLGGVTRPLRRRARRPADDEPAAVLEHVLAGRRVGFERDVGYEPRRAGGDAAARLE